MNAAALNFINLPLYSKQASSQVVVASTSQLSNTTNNSNNRLYQAQDGHRFLDAKSLAINVPASNGIPANQNNSVTSTKTTTIGTPGTDINTDKSRTNKDHRVNNQQGKIHFGFEGFTGSTVLMKTCIGKFDFTT